MGAGSLAEKICERFRVDAPAVQGEPVAQYNRKRIGWELERTAMGDGYYGNALRVAKDIPGLTDQDRAVLDRYATGSQHDTDHIALQDIAMKVYAAPQPAEQQQPCRQSPPDDPLGGLEHRADGEANFHTLSRPTGSWVARIQFNGELHTHEQERILNAMLGDRNVRYGDGYHQGYWDARQESPDVAGLVEALEAALMVMTSKEVRLEKQADAITMVRSQLAAHRKGGE